MATVLKEEDVRRLLTMDEALGAVEDAFRAVAHGDAVNVPRQRGALRDVTMNVLCAISTALDVTGIKCYPVVRKGTTVGASFTMLVYKISTGSLIGVLQANTLGQIRTGAASGVATKYMARPESRVMTLFGAGWQARSQLEAISRVLPNLERINVVGRSPERVQQFCVEMADRLHLELVPSTDTERAVKQADVITTITGSSEPVFDGHWLQPGVHINAAGSNFAEKQELDATAVRLATRIVVDDLAVARMECGDLLAAEPKIGLDWDSVHSLSEVVSGMVRGRTSRDEITLFESHGLGLEDLAVAKRVLDLAQRGGIGMEIPLR